MKLVGMSRGSFVGWGGAALIQVKVLVVGIVGASMWGSRVVGGGGFGHDWDETSSGFDESRS
jgi:hypothetical protein